MSSPVVDTSASINARLRAASPADVRIADAFWEPRMRANRETTLFGQYEHCESTGRINNFRRAAGKRPGTEFEGIYFNDSDVYKWLEAAAWSLGTHPDPAVAKMVATVAEEIAAAQAPDGYLNTYFTFDKAGERYSNLRDMHELYCAGHFIQAAVAHKRATGGDALLNVAVRLADQIVETFGPGKRVGACGHEEAEMAFVELYRETRDTRYLDQAQLFIDARGRKPPVLGGGAYLQDHAPYVELSENVGHAVRMLYYNCGAADVALERNVPAIRETLDRLWADFTGTKMYITGGAGARWDGEAFGAAYELPSRAYAETCAGIGLLMWAHRMNLLTAESRYVDVMERALYNGILSGLSLAGDAYFYQNPLSDRGGHRREPWFGCACCPPNVARLLAELPGYAFAAGQDAVYVNLYVQGEADVDGVHLDVRTRYPWDGAVEIAVNPGAERDFTLNLRIPDWCEGAGLAVNGEPADAPMTPGAYAAVCRTWKDGDKVALFLPMDVRAWQAHPHVEAEFGKLAITRGPLAYCLEAADNPGVDVWDVAVAPDAEWSAEFRPELLGGVVALTADAAVADASAWAGSLYRPAPVEPVYGAARVTAIPYYAWANREAGPMTVWMNVSALIR
ncbi:MAG TPA: beta-L-arabinofuranosidase domain-containing protein [Armatimonadota bacterium]|jgi:hypothetical protein